ncbi:MAG TPA: hypothetical protein VMB50_04640, partial [Myxococcales bacterium]|nr:hypothetical protein [Myxococcales bacterium]
GDNSGYVNDSCDRLTKQVDALGNDVQYGYDDGGNLLFVQDQNGHQTQAERAGGRAFEPRRHRHRQHGGRGLATADVERQAVEK